MISDERPLEFRIIWEEKPVLRSIYQAYYQEIVSRCRQGQTLEIGSGSGNLKQFLPDVVSTDIMSAPWLDAVADAHYLPFANASFDNIVFFDVLHHLERPRMFFEEAARILRPGGRIVMVEPAITPVSGVFYRHFHPEPVIMQCDPLEVGELTPGRDAFDANQAIPTLLFGRDKARFATEFPTLKVTEVSKTALFAYPLSGGFRKWSLLPAIAVKPLLKLERRLVSALGWLMAFRMVVVIEHST